MPAEVDVCNVALARVGASRITGIDDGSTNANHCLTLYPPLRTSLLRSHHWNFAMTSVQLAQDESTAEIDYVYAYTLPSDCLKVVEYSGGAPTAALVTVPGLRPHVGQYVIRGRKLLSNDGEAYITYLRDVDNPGEWDGLFFQVVTWWLASDLAAAILKDAGLAQKYLQIATALLLPMASAVDGQEGTVVPMVVDDLTWGR